MESGFGQNLEGFLIKGNLSLISGDIPVMQGDGSIEAAGRLYINHIQEYDVFTGVNIQDILIKNQQVLVPYTQPSVGLTTASFIMDGGVSILATANSTSLTSGGGLTIGGGASIGKNVHVGGLLDVSGNRILNVAPPTLGTDGVNKDYVDSVAGEISGNFSTGQVIIGGVGDNLVGYSSFTFDGAQLSVATPVFIASSSNVVNGTTASFVTLGGATFGQNVQIGGQLDVTGSSILQFGVTTGTLNVTGESLLNASVTAGALNVTGASILQLGITAGALNVTGESLLNGTITAGGLNVTGATIINGAVTAGALNVTGSSFFQDDVLITGGNLTVSGGSIIFNTVDVSPSMADIVKERSASIANNVSTPTPVAAFSFDSAVARAFDAVVSVTINGTSGNSYAYYNLKGVQKDSGNWVLNSSFVGDITGITFSIDNGQVNYTTQNKPDFDSGLVKFRALTTTV